MSASDAGALRAFLDGSPSPVHAIREAAEVLTNAGFVESPPGHAARHGFTRNAGSLIAWTSPPHADPKLPFRILAAHTDSPGFRVKPDPEHPASGFTQLGMEVYGGPLLNSWLDRDLGLAGSVLVDVGPEPEIRLLRDDRAVLRIPQLAIHLDRGVNEHGVKLHPQQHLRPIWALGERPRGAFRDYLADLVATAPERIRSFELMPFDTAPARLGGLDNDLIFSARLDDLLCCHAALAALLDAGSGTETNSIVVLVDHEEVGSTSATGAQSRWILSVLERLADSRDASRTEFLESLESSCAVSADMAHATHPNYPERHDGDHPVRLGAGPVIKHNAQQRYATSLSSMSPFLAACDATSVPVQHFVSHSDLPCGSTIGPSLAAGLGVDVVDVGVAQLAMHSAREVCAIADHASLHKAFVHFLTAR